MAKSYEELSFADDFMFGKVMEDKELCRELLECLLEQPVGELQDIQSEREFRYTADGKPIRLDVYTKDQKNIYDTEMQNLNHKTLEDLELAKRSRFYQSMMDADFLQKGKTYGELLEGKVLFLCTFDPFGKGYARYTFENRCRENPEIKMEDGTEKIFYNCTCKSLDIPENLKHLYQYIQYGNKSDELTKRIDSAVNHIKRNEKWRSEYMKELLHDYDVRMEGRAEGRAEALAEFREEGIQMLICTYKELNQEYSFAKEKVQEKFHLTEDEIEHYLQLFW